MSPQKNYNIETDVPTPTYAQISLAVESKCSLVTHRRRLRGNWRRSLCSGVVVRSWLRWHHHGIRHSMGELWTGVIVGVRRHLLRRHGAWTSRCASGRRRGSAVWSMWHVMGRRWDSCHAWRWVSIHWSIRGHMMGIGYRLHVMARHIWRCWGHHHRLLSMGRRAVWILIIHHWVSLRWLRLLSRDWLLWRNRSLSVSLLLRGRIFLMRLRWWT